MKTFFQLTLLTAALSASSSHAVIRKVTQTLKGLMLLPRSYLNSTLATPPPGYLKRKKSNKLWFAQVVTQYSFKTQKEDQQIADLAKKNRATEVK